MDKLEEVRINAMLFELGRQREQAQSVCGQLAGEIAVLKHQLEEAQSKASELTPKEEVA